MTSTVAAELISCDYCICVLLICSAEIQYIVCHVQLVVIFLCKLCEISIEFYSVCLLDQQEGCQILAVL